MTESEIIFSSKIKQSGIFNFREFYSFCYSWLTEEMGLDVAENKYVEKLKGDSKDIGITWTGTKKITDYFQYKVKVTLSASTLTNVEINEGGKKIKTNKGGAEINVIGTLIRDYQGKFELSAFQKFLRSIYEKWVIPARIEQFEGKLFEECDEFLNQVKAYLDLEGKR